MNIKTLLLASSLFFVVAGETHATCVNSPDSEGPVPVNLSFPASVIAIDADQAADTATPIAEIETPTPGYPTKWDHCVTGDRTGKNVTGALLTGSPQDGNKMFLTNIPGIKVKLLSYNGSAYSDLAYPYSTTLNAGDSNEMAVTYSSNIKYKLQVFKTAPSLSLDPQGQNLLLQPGPVAYAWLNVDSMADPNVSQIITLDNLTLVSTPSCTFENAKTVNFGTVSGNLFDSGAQLQKPLDFAITCRSDYSTYGATASISSDSASTDGNYLKVRDASGASDALAIAIKDGAGNPLKLDGSNNESRLNIASNSPAEFHWTASLMAQPGVTKHPAEGSFTAHAEILLQVK